MSEQHSVDYGTHAGCASAWDAERRRADLAEARLDALVIELRQLALVMDAIQGHTTHDLLNGRTLGGAVRFVAAGEPAPRPIPPSSDPAPEAPGGES